MKKYLLKGGFVVDGETREVKIADVLVADGIVGKSAKISMRTERKPWIARGFT